MASSSRLWVLLLVFLPIAAPAQPAAPVHITLGQAAVPLYGPWKFHIGDSPLDPATHRPLWAEPNFNDSGWETVDLTPKSGAFDPVVGMPNYVPGWTAKGHPGYSGYGWYRIHLQINDNSRSPLAIAGPADVDDAYQVFLDATLLGSFGRFTSAEPITYSSRPRMFAVPESMLSGSPESSVLAFRVWMEQGTVVLDADAGGIHNAPVLGDLKVVTAYYRLAWLDLVRGYLSHVVEGILFLVLAIFAAGLLLFDRADRVYLWIAAAFLLTSLTGLNLAIFAWTQLESAAWISVLEIGRPLELGAWIMVWWTWFRLRRPAWIPPIVGILTVAYILSATIGGGFLSSVSPAVFHAFYIVSYAVRLLALALLVLVGVAGIRQQGREGWLALPALILTGVAQFQTELRIFHLRSAWFPFGITLSLAEVADLLLALVMSLLLLRRLLHSVRRQREMALDVKQAREVQQVILPEAIATVPGLTIQSEYRPAREVGGDFFQIIPCAEDNSLLVVAGDVTGKGLQAGMLVALLVGAIRTEARHTSDPLTMLCALNDRLLGRGQAHGTCLALRIAEDGSVTLANAGHLPPYLNGRPVEMEGALPLGMIPQADFSLTRFQLAEGDTLLLLSDGIAEARDKDGSLFGFERVEGLVRDHPSPAEIADAAQSFGQEDDITVISLTRSAVPQPLVA